RRARCAIRLVHVLDEDDARAAELGGEDRSPRAAAEEYLAGVARRIAEYSEVSVSTVVRDGPVIDSLLAERLESKAEFIVMTTHGRGGVARAWLGSVTDHLIRHAIMPVLAV